MREIKSKLQEIKNVLMHPDGQNIIDLVDQAIELTEDQTGSSPGPFGSLHLGRGTFGQAIAALKQGHKVSRSGWNGKKMFLFLLPAGTIPKSAIHDPALKKVLEDNGKDSFDALGSIRMKTADDKILTGWLASQTDILEEDWGILE